MADFTVARILAERTVPDGDGEATLYDLAVETPSGEVRFTDVRPVQPEGLVFGAWVGGRETGQQFVPISIASAAPASSAVLARITDSEVFDTNRWRYQWVQVGPGADGEWAPVADGLTSTDDGPAYNAMELPTNLMGSGVNTSNLPSGFAPVPIGVGAVVVLSGPFYPDAPWWSFSASPHVDGTCG